MLLLPCSHNFLGIATTFLLLLAVAPGEHADAALVQAIQRGRRRLLPAVVTAARGAVGGRGVA